MSGILQDEDVRLFLADDPEANLLIGDYEFTPQQISRAQELAVAKWNETPPTIPEATFTVESFPWHYNLLKQVTANLLAIAAHGYTRNKLNYNITGGSVNDKAKDGDYLNLAQTYSQEFSQWMMGKKAEINMTQMWGVVG